MTKSRLSTTCGRSKTAKSSPVLLHNLKHRQRATYLPACCHPDALGNPSSSLAVKDRSPMLIAVGVVGAGGAAVISCAHFHHL